MRADRILQTISVSEAHWRGSLSKDFHKDDVLLAVERKGRTDVSYYYNKTKGIFLKQVEYAGSLNTTEVWTIGEDELSLEAVKRAKQKGFL